MIRGRIVNPRGYGTSLLSLIIYLTKQILGIRTSVSIKAKGQLLKQ